MFLSAVCWISISAASVNYKDLVADVDNTLNECLSITDEVWKYVGEVDLLRDVRRRDEKKGSDAITDKLEACVSMQKAVDNYRESHGRLMLGQKVVQSQEMAYLNQLLVPLSKEIGTLPIYVASYDGDGASDFHDNCDGKGPTVVIVESRTGHVFGGYTDVSWSSSGGSKKSSSSFLFQLRPNFIQYDIKDGGAEAVCHHSNYGPNFGCGSDLYIGSRALLNDTLSYSKGYRYNVNRYDLHGGQTGSFHVKDYVVFEAVSK